MNEKQLTDEEIVKALQCCGCFARDCEECDYYGDDGCIATLHAVDLIHRLQAENERLHAKVITETVDYCYDALAKALKTIVRKQAVKDTAKEIYDEIGDSDILVVETQEYGEIEVVPIERLKEIVKSKGVEVE